MVNITKAVLQKEDCFFVILLDFLLQFNSGGGMLMEEILEKINGAVWGLPTVLLIIGVGLLISFKTGFAQITLFPLAVRDFVRKFRKPENGDGTSAYQALCTALAATVGTGNIAGVAGAICLGGPGSIFWMWICGFIGMATKYAEAVLAVRYRRKNAAGEYIGGPMYMIRQGLHSRYRYLAYIYCFFGVVAAFGVGNATQVNAVIGGINGAIIALGGQQSRIVDIGIAVALCIVVGLVLFGGAKRIGRIAESIVPFAAVFYVLLCLGVLLVRLEHIPAVFSQIMEGAFSPRSVTGGMVGSAFVALRVGASRGVFTNEAGMGTASIAHAAADVDHPCRQGLMGIMEVFIDTILICTLTAFVILCSGVSIPYSLDTGVSLTVDSFSSVYGMWICVPLAVCLCAFALATIFGWGLYGIRCAQFLFGDKVWKPFSALQVATVMLGALLGTGTIWLLADSVNALMAIPNLMALFLLMPELVRLTNDFKSTSGRNSALGGTNEDIHQRKPLRAFSYAKVPSNGGKGGTGR